MDLPKKNGAAVMETLRDMDARVRGQQIRVDKLNEALSTALARIEALESQLAVMRVMTQGHGPSVR